MGVDIYGRKQEWVGIKPEIDWSKEHSEQAKDEFFKLVEEFEDNNPGYYFRSNWWGWRPIVMLCEIAAQNSDLDIDFKYWGSNDGKGLETQEECNALVEALEQTLNVVNQLSNIVEYLTIAVQAGAVGMVPSPTPLGAIGIGAFPGKVVAAPLALTYSTMAMSNLLSFKGNIEIQKLKNKYSVDKLVSRHNMTN